MHITPAPEAAAGKTKAVSLDDKSGSREHKTLKAEISFLLVYSLPLNHAIFPLD